MQKVVLRADGQYDPDVVSQATGLRGFDKSRTQQQFAEEVDINTIVRRFGIDGQLPQGVRMPSYGDFTGLSDYQEAMNAVRLAGEAFMQMPARVRARFGHDPAEFVAFCSDEANAAEAARLGLVKPEVLEAQAAALAAAGAGKGAGAPAGGAQPPVVAAPSGGAGGAQADAKDTVAT